MAAKIHHCNYQNLLINEESLPGSLVGAGIDRAKVIDVPGRGDCAFLALLSPLLGFIPDKRDSLGIVKRFRKKLSDLVLEKPENFDHIFGGRKG